MTARRRVRALAQRLGGLFKGKDELELTSGPIGKPLLFLSFPIVITNLLQVAYNLADTFWLGQYSTTALAAISFAFPMIFLLISLGMGLSVAGSVLVAQHTGAEEPDRAEYAASQTLTFAVIASVLLGTAGFFFVEDFLSVLGASDQVLPGATGYLQVVSLGLTTMFGFFVFISLMRGAGDTVTPMLVMLGTVVLNIVIDPFLIFGWWLFPELGVVGAAVATVFSRGLAFAVGIAIMLRGDHGIQINPQDMVPDFTYLKKLLAIGVPASIEGTGRALSVNAMLFIVGTFSVTVVAAFGVGIRVFSLVFMPAIAMDRGVETMTGQNLGAERPERAAEANHFAAKVSFLLLSALGVVTIFAAPTVVSVFSNDPEVVRIGAEFLQWVAPTFGFIGIVRAYSGGFRGAGKTLTSAALAVTMLGVVRLPVAWVASRAVPAPAWLASVPLPSWLGGPLATPSWVVGPVTDVLAFSLAEQGIWLSFGVSNVIAAVIAVAWFTRGSWREADPRGGPEAAVADD
ncbi:MATE family efflux transporter [Haloarcula sp. S1CR25-12]|uniref:MATE family efflux transporter n=1 Tax=Haloarcula saliterrae TaxID=2950534 RepID=A0ABU2FEZ0_9EURY|nr:MATE family efflux transporter [Haloarcula sp. S1CR25-12]MDS0260371.1 MATE family efflux transporter [Haloarcula sp. S1CR25-12]